MRSSLWARSCASWVGDTSYSGPNNFLDQFPTVTREVAVHALEYAKLLVADDIRFSAAVNAGLAAADRGDFVEHDEVGERVKKILQR